MEHQVGRHTAHGTGTRCPVGWLIRDMLLPLISTPTRIITIIVLCKKIKKNTDSTSCLFANPISTYVQLLSKPTRHPAPPRTHSKRTQQSRFPGLPSQPEFPKRPRAAKMRQSGAPSWGRHDCQDIHTSSIPVNLSRSRPVNLSDRSCAPKTSQVVVARISYN